MTPAFFVASLIASGAAAASPDTLTYPVTLLGDDAEMRVTLALDADSGGVSILLPEDSGYSRVEFALRDRFDESCSARFDLDGPLMKPDMRGAPVLLPARRDLLRRLVDRPQRFELELIAHSDQGVLPHSDQGPAVVMRGAIPVAFEMCLIGPYVVTSQGGDPDGLSVGTLYITDQTNEISWDFTYENVGPPTLWVIHAAPAGQGGGSVLGLGVGGEPGRLFGSTIGDHVLVDQMLADPASFYIDLHNDEYPDGAVRGQLQTPPCDWDLSRNCVVNAADIAELLSRWNDPYEAVDLANLIGSWGLCDP